MGTFEENTLTLTKGNVSLSDRLDVTAPESTRKIKKIRGTSVVCNMTLILSLLFFDNFCMFEENAK